MAKDKLENILFKIIEYGVYVALFSPLIVNKNYFFPFVSPKTIFFRIVVDIIFVAYIVLAASNPKYRPRITPLAAALALFVGVLFFTSIIGVNFERSFWSVFERMTGLLTFLHLFAFYVVLVSCFQERKYWEKILSASVLAASLISLYVLFSQDVVTKGGGTLGNSSFLSSYLIFNIFFAAFLLIWKKGFSLVAYGSALALFLVLLFFNPGNVTRGAVSAFIVGMICLAVFYLFSLRERKFKNIALLLVILLILGTIGFFQLDFVKEKIDELRQSSSIRSRLIIGSIAFEAWQEKPWFGWGWENFNVPFAKYYPPALPFTGDAWYDRVHNVVLDTGAASGIIGLLSYLSIFGVAIFALAGWARIVLAQAQKRDILVPLALIALLLVYFLQNLWVFDMISSYIMFFLTLAFIGFSIYPKEQKEQTKAVPLPNFVAGLLIVVAVFALFYGNIQPARASRQIIKGLVYGVEQSVPAFQKALSLSPITQFEVPERFSARLDELATLPNQNPQLIIYGFQAAEEEFKKAILKNPKDIRLMMFLGRHYNSFYQITGDKQKLAQAQEVLQKAIEISPGNQQLYWTLTQTRLHQGESKEALALAAKALDMEPKLLQSYVVLVQVAYFIGDKELAQEKIEEALEINPGWSEKDLTKLLEFANMQK